MKYTKGRNRASRILYFHHGKYGAVSTNVKTHGMAAPDADIIVTGHTHNLFSYPLSRMKIDNVGNVKLQLQHHFKTGTYKNPFLKEGGWDIQQIPKPPALGAWWIELEMENVKSTEVTIGYRLAN